MKNKIINGLSALVIAVSLSSTAGAADLVIQSDSEFMFGIKPLLKKKLNNSTSGLTVKS